MKILLEQFPYRYVEKGTIELNGMPDYRIQKVDSYTGKYKDMLGAFKCELKKNPKIKFDISGMDDEIRKNYKKTHKVGTIVTFTYMGLTGTGVPRHPNYLRIRKGKL